MNMTIAFQLLIAGVLTDADSTPILRDDGGTFGVRRTDTDEVIVDVSPAPTEYTRTAAGTYSYVLADITPGVTYEFAFEAVVNGVTYHGTKVKTAPADISTDSYLGVDEADALAATLPAGTPGMSQYNAADSGQRAALLLMGTIDIDRAMRYQGAKCDPGQALEFPRVAYAGRFCFGAYPVAGSTLDIWDWNSTDNVAVVPAKVKLATLLQACSLARGDRSERVQAIADGLASKSVGSMSESYRGDAAASPLCERAASIMAFYRLRQGELL